MLLEVGTDGRGRGRLGMLVEPRQRAQSNFKGERPTREAPPADGAVPARAVALRMQVNRLIGMAPLRSCCKGYGTCLRLVRKEVAGRQLEAFGFGVGGLPETAGEHSHGEFRPVRPDGRAR